MSQVETDKRRKATQTASFAILGAMGGWFLINWLAVELGWSVRVTLFADLACLAVLAWALFVMLQVWQFGRNEGK